MKGGGETAAVEFLSPWDGAHLKESRVILTGRLPSKQAAGFFVNGTQLKKARQTGRSFTAVFQAAKGRNTVEVRQGKVRGRLSFTYGAGMSAGSPYVYHQPVADGECSVCHSGAAGKGRIGESATCYECHDSKAGRPFVHGPVGAGECRACHDPHGSALPRMVRASSRELCLMCHDQPSSKSHVEGSRTRECHRCHDPHGGNDRLFMKK